MLITNYVSYYNTQYINSNDYVLSGINPSVSRITNFPTNGNHYHDSFVINPGLNNITIENIYFRGTGNKRNPTYHIVVDNDCSNIIIRGCVFDGATGGIIVRPGCKNVFILGCTFRNMVYVPGAGAGNNGVISGCVFEPTVVRHAVYIQSSSDVLISDNIIYGTTAMNNQTLLDALLTTGLTEAQIDAFDVTKHMTVYDSAISFRGCSNVRIINNYLSGGICCLNGSMDVANPQHGGELYLFKDNIVKNFTKPSGGINRLFNLNNINTVIKENNTISSCTGYSQYW